MTISDTAPEVEAAAPRLTAECDARAAPGENGDATSPAGRRSGRFPCFDGLRGIAVLMVVVLHSAFYAGFTQRSKLGSYIGRLEIGVSVFFLMSGFLLYRPFAVSHLSNRPAPRAGRFYIRRLLRIVPAYWVALTIIVYGFHAVSIGRGWQAVVAQYTLTQIYFPQHISNGIVQAWSLCTEMSFYLFLPVYAGLLAFGNRSRSPRRQVVRELGGIALLVVASFGFRTWTLNQPANCSPNCWTRPALVSTMSSWLPSYIDLFALGMGLAVLSAWFALHDSEPGWLRHRRMPWISWALAAATFWVVSHLGISPLPIYVISPGLNILKQSLYGIFALFLLLPAVFGPQDHGAIRRLLRSWPLVGLGVISYAVYLWHIAIVTQFIKWAGYKQNDVPYGTMLKVVLVWSVAIGVISYFVVERPVLRLKDANFTLNVPFLRPWRRTLGESFEAPDGAVRRNSLNFLRVALALMVIFSHAIGLGGFGKDWVGNRTTWANIAVYGFFGISGFLIARSAVRNSFGRFLWQRALRILPAAWVSLVATAFAFGFVGWLSRGHSAVSYFGLHDGPIQYVYRNVYFQLRYQKIAGITWNTSLWTLMYELLCYVILATLGVIGVLRRRQIVLALLALSWLTEAVVIMHHNFDVHFGATNNWFVLNLMTFLPVFMVGAVLYLYRDRVPDSKVLALTCVALFVMSLWLPFGAHFPAFSLTSSNLFAPFLAYPMLWLGLHLPFRNVGTRNDYSYGLYIYAYPVQQLLIVWHVQRWGYFAYVGLTLLGTIPLAVASWWLIERKVLRFKKVDFRKQRKIARRFEHADVILADVDVGRDPPRVPSIRSEQPAAR